MALGRHWTNVAPMRAGWLIAKAGVLMKPFAGAKRSEPRFPDLILRQSSGGQRRRLPDKQSRVLSAKKIRILRAAAMWHSDVEREAKGIARRGQRARGRGDERGSQHSQGQHMGLPSEDGPQPPPPSKRQTGIPRMRALSARFPVIPEPGKTMTPIGKVCSSASLHLKGAPRT